MLHKIKNKFRMFLEQKKSIDNIYTLDGRVPFLRSIPYGFQHILAMFVANITPVIIVAGVCGLGTDDTARLIQTAMIIAGIGTLIQLFPLWRVGAKMPVVMGISFTFVSALCVIGASDGGYAKIMGAVIVGGIAEGLLGLFAKYWRKIISPIVAACVVTSIGFSLFSVGANSFGGGNGAADFGSWQNWLLGGITLLCCILFNMFAKGHRKQLSILFGLIVGYIVAICLGKVDFSALHGVGIISFPKILPVMPQFDIGAIISIAVIFMVSATETIGDTSALASSAFDREPTDKEISGGLACDGFVSTISGLLGCLPITSFSQNIGLVAMTKVINRYTIATGAGIMILAGFFPAVGTVLSTLPESVLGGCTIMMFGSIVISGIQMLVKCGFSDRNITIASLSLSIGVGFTLVPEIFSKFPQIIQSIFAQNCVAVVFVVALILDLVMPKNAKNK